MTGDPVTVLLERAREDLDRLTPREAVAAVASGAHLVDIRPAWQREIDGEIPGALIVERNHLEWRLHPLSGASLPIADRVERWIVVCTEGYTSSLAAASLRQIGLEATDLDGGVHAWRDAGFEVARSVTPVEGVVRESTNGRGVP